MGMLMDFYTGDAAEIAAAWRRGDLDALTAPGIVAAHADLSLHLWDEDLDALVRCACELSSRAPLTFSGCVEGDRPQEAESGIHELTPAFRDLFAALSAEQAARLAERWRASLPDDEPPPPARERAAARLAERIRDGLIKIVFYVLVLPLFGVAWLLSPKLRADRRAGKAKAAAARAAPPEPEYGMHEAVAALVETCRTAKAQERPVLFAWSL